MKPTSEQHNDFLANRPLPGVFFSHNDPVKIIGGEYTGDLGSIISIEDLGQDPVYLVELSSGEDIEIQQSCLKANPEDQGKPKKLWWQFWK